MLLGGHKIHVFTDHRNLLYIFATRALDANLGRHIISKVQRWAIYLSRFEFVIEHIDGELNVCADMLTRWAKGYRTEKAQTQKISSLVLENSQIIPTADEIIWPSMEDIRKSQQNKPAPANSAQDEAAILRCNGKIWIPEDCEELKLKIMVISHTSSMGHRGIDATRSIISESFWWETLEKDLRNFIKNCLHCIVSRTGDIRPRPLASALHGSRPNEVVHIDYLYMGKEAFGNLKYILLIKDDLSSFVWLWPTHSATGDAAVDAITTWISTFGAMEWIVSDQGPHFNCELFKGVTSDLKVNHHFTTAYSPWANGTVERVCKEVLRACQALLLEFKLSPKEWPSVTECIQSILNQSPLKRLGLRDKSDPQVYRSPLEVFTSHLPSRPLLRALPIEKYQTLPSLSIIRAQQVADIDAVQHSLEEMHRDVE